MKKRTKKTGKYCVKSGKRTMSCHRKKSVANRAARKFKRGRVVSKA